MPFYMLHPISCFVKKKSYHSLDDNWLWTDKYVLKNYVYSHKLMVLLIKKRHFYLKVHIPDTQLLSPTI